MIDPTYFREVERRTESLLRIGVVHEVFHEEGKCRVKFGDRMSAKVKWGTTKAGDDRVYWHPDVGEQVLVFAPFGEESQGIVGPSIFSELIPHPGGREGLHIVEYRDGTRFEYDRANHKLKLFVNGDIEIKATGNIVIQGARIDLNP